MLDRLPPLLPFIPGLPVSMTLNKSPKRGLANESTGKIVGSIFRRYDVEMNVISRLPTAALLQFPRNW